MTSCCRGPPPSISRLLAWRGPAFVSEIVLSLTFYLFFAADESLAELRVLCSKFDFHAQSFKDWLRTGGPINPLWARDTIDLRRDLHRAQCRAAQRIFSADQEANTRCLGAFLVYRRLRQHGIQKQKGREGQALLPQFQQDQQIRDESIEADNPYQGAAEEPRRGSLEAAVPDCNRVGTFERFGDRDVVFVCDYCDGHLVWVDVKQMPSTRTDPAPLAQSTYPNWQASARSQSTGEEKTIVFAPLVIANHLAPGGGVGWEARIWCPFCDEYTYYDQVDDEQTRYAQDEGGFTDVQSFQDHLAWHHTAIGMPSLPALSSLPALPSLSTSSKNCTVM